MKQRLLDYRNKYIYKKDSRKGVFFVYVIPYPFFVIPESREARYPESRTRQSFIVENSR